MVRIHNAASGIIATRIAGAVVVINSVELVLRTLALCWERLPRYRTSESSNCCTESLRMSAEWDNFEFRQ